MSTLPLQSGSPGGEYESDDSVGDSCAPTRVICGQAGGPESGDDKDANSYPTVRFAGARPGKGDDVAAGCVFEGTSESCRATFSSARRMINCAGTN